MRETRAMLIACVGISPLEVGWMTPREIAIAFEGYLMREKREWSRTLRMTQSWGDKMTVEKMFKNAEQKARRSASRSASADEYMALKQSWGLA